MSDQRLPTKAELADDMRNMLAEKDKRIAELTAEEQRQAGAAILARQEAERLRASIPTPEALAEAIVRSVAAPDAELRCALRNAIRVPTPTSVELSRILADVIRQAMEKKGTDT
jgi:hypothetical protein